MTAIAGLISLNKQPIEGGASRVEEMLELMRHRGPDSIGVRLLPEGTAALGAAAINLSTARTQCVSIATAPYIVFDGELFNGRAEGQTDLEVFQECYQKYGKNCFKHLDGSYACAVIDGDEAFIARDHVGARPVFYGTENGLFCFSSEMKGIMGDIRFDIHELEPGHLYSTKHGLLPFDAFVPETPEAENLEQATTVVRDLLVKAVEKRMEGLNAISLSGGLDSSIVAAIAKQYNPDIHLFTGTIESADAPDLPNAILMAKFLGQEHHIYRITDEDIVDFIPDAVWYLSLIHISEPTRPY